MDEVLSQSSQEMLDELDPSSPYHGPPRKRKLEFSERRKEAKHSQKKLRVEGVKTGAYSDLCPRNVQLTSIISRTFDLHSRAAQTHGRT